MTSSERKELRYKRRKEKREKKNNRRCELYSDINNAFRFSKVMHYADKCCNGVRWKKSTKSFMLHKFTIIANINNRDINASINIVWEGIKAYMGSRGNTELQVKIYFDFCSIFSHILTIF